MECKGIWDEICFHMEKNKNASERDFQTTVEFLFEKLGWSQYQGEIVSQVRIPVGATQSIIPDIIIKNNGKNIFVVELKKPNIVISERNTEQLISYMRQLKLNFGILIGETLQIYYELPNDNKLPVRVNEIYFEKNSEAGAYFIEVFGKNGFSEERAKKYCIDKLTYNKKLEKSQSFLDLLCSIEGSKIVTELIKEKFSNEYSDEIITSMIDKINIKISKKGSEIITITDDFRRKPNEKNRKSLFRNEEFEKIIANWNNKYELYKTHDTDERYNFRRIFIRNWPKQLHYEFEARRNDIISFGLDNETNNIDNDYLLKKYHNIEISNYRLRYYVPKTAGKLRIELRMDNNMEIIHSCMTKIIEITENEISHIIGV